VDTSAAAVSDEFVDVILGKLVEALRPGLYDQLEEATLNAALAIIDSMQPRSELQALLAVEIIATGFAGLRFLRQSHRNMTEDFINVYGNYAIKLLRLQNEMIQTFERYRRGSKQTVEVRHVHIHPGGQGVVGIINPPDDRDAGVWSICRARRCFRICCWRRGNGSGPAAVASPTSASRNRRQAKR
jgi:hypothetical protein